MLKLRLKRLGKKDKMNLWERERLKMQWEIINGKEFKGIGSVDGNGNTNKPHRYSFKYPEKRHGYYRIKQVDYDKRYSYSQLKSVHFRHHEDIKLHPNPNHGQFTVIPPHNFEQFELILTNGRGKVVYKEHVNEKHPLHIHLKDNLNPGVYHLKLFNHQISEYKKVVIH